MTGRAYVGANFPFDGVDVYLGHDLGGRRLVADPTELSWSPTPEGEATTAQPPTLRLPDDVARALLDALAAHYGGTSEVQTLRKDYLAERARVDKMIDHLTSSPVETVSRIAQPDLFRGGDR